jgi:hypothetical protein
MCGLSTNTGASGCDLGSAFPGATEQPSTLYVLWNGCTKGLPGAGEQFFWQGYNFEFIPASRQLVLHCYQGTPFIYLSAKVEGIAAIPPPELFMIPDKAFGTGAISVVSDYRLEHWLGDSSDEAVVDTATIS